MNFCPKYLRTFTIICWILISGNVFAYHTINYNAKNGISSNAVRKIFIDHSHRVWLGTDNGVSLISGNGIRNYVYTNGLKFDKIWEIAECPDSTLWFASFGNGLYLFEKGMFIHYAMPRSSTNNSIRKLHPYKKLLFIGTEAGLNAFDFKSRKFIPFKNLSLPDSFQILDFFEYKNRLYFQSFYNGTFEINYEKRTYKKIRFNPEENKWNYSAYQSNDMLYLARTRFMNFDTHNLLRIRMNDYLKGLPMDSLHINTVIWKFANDNMSNLYAACWGVRDDSGGLFRLSGNSMIKVNAELGVNSDKLWDLYFDKLTNKLYIGSLDKGLFVTDMSQIVYRTDFAETENVLDVKVIKGGIYILTSNKLVRVLNGKVDKIILKSTFDSFLKKHSPINKKPIDFLNSPLTFRDINIAGNELGITTNHGVVRLDLSLNIVDYIYTGSDIHVCFMQNDDALIFRDYDRSELYENFGKGNYKAYSLADKSTARDITHYCTLNDTTFLLSCYAHRFYVYKQKSYCYKRFTQLDNVRLSGFVDRLAENKFMLLDQSNVLFEGVYAKDSLLVKKRLDLRDFGVLESYFMKVLNGMTLAATNRGIFIIEKGNIYLVDASIGLPPELVLKTAQYFRGNLYVGTSEGLFCIDLNKLKSLHTNYQLDNLILHVNGENLQYRIGQKITLNNLPDELVVNWELNRHPYPDKLTYYYRLNDKAKWNKVLSLGQIRLKEATFGTNTVYLQIQDELQNKKIELKLLVIQISEPFYSRMWFILLMTFVFISFCYTTYYQIYLRRLRKKSEVAFEENKQLRLRIATLQFLLKPHFIFNAITSIQNLIIKKDIDKSLEYSGHFSRFLRGIMDNSGDELIPLDEELKNTQNYIALEKLRFNNDLNIVVRIDESINPATTLIIPFLFQPLVENSFKHAFTNKIEQPRITIEVILSTTHKIIYRISDNGIGLQGRTFEEVVNSTTSKGLKIIQAQLEKFYGKTFTFTSFPNTPLGVVWEITIPI